MRMLITQMSCYKTKNPYLNREALELGLGLQV